TGDEVEVSLLEVAVHLQGPNWGEYLLTGKPPVRSGNGQPTVAPAADIMPTLDGAIVLSAYSAPHFAKLCELIARPDLARDERFESNAARVRNRSALLIELRAAFADQSTDQAMDLLTPNGIVAGRISSYDEVRKNPDVEATGLFIEVDGADGTQHTTLGAPWNLGSVPSSSRAGAPTLGQHTAEILGRLGYSPEDIADLQAQRVIHLP
ncbi:CoA transferase, partial [Rhodococcus wratislaviensis]|uniref:CoA transferase n=1 Tax=Rhodococcus wratislaviensis TaxID=44752 RepID=UPI0036537DA6